MESEDDVRALLTHAASGPPMRLDADGVIARGARIRRRRKRFAVAGSSAATAAAIVVAGFLAGHHGGASEPVEPAGPGPSTVETITPAPSSPGPASESEPSATQRPTS